MGCLSHRGGTLLHHAFNIALVYKQNGTSSPGHARRYGLSPGTCVHFKWPFPDLPLRLGWPSSQACSILIPDPSKAHLHVSPCEKEDGQRAALPATSWRTVHRMTHSLAGWDPSSLPKETVSTVLWFCLVLNSQNLFLRLYPFLGD